jgi:hypothetical protein
MRTSKLFERLFGLTFAAVLTVAMLAGVDTLAGTDPTPQQLARAGTTAHL